MPEELIDGSLIDSIHSTVYLPNGYEIRVGFDAITSCLVITFGGNDKRLLLYEGVLDVVTGEIVSQRTVSVGERVKPC